MSENNHKSAQGDSGNSDSSPENSPSGSGGGRRNGRLPSNGGSTITTVGQFESGTTQFLLPREEVHQGEEQQRNGYPQGGPPYHPRRHWTLWPALAALAILAILVVYYVRSRARAESAAAKAKEAEAGASITVGRSTTGDMNIYVDALGTVTPIHTITLYSQITGQVMAVHYTEGQIVNQGDPLVDIDPRPYETTLMQAEGTLERDQYVLAQATMDLNRYKAALDKNAIARQQYEDQVQIVAQNRGTVKADEGAVANAKVQLSYCHIVSPISGRVGLRLVDPGNTVFAGSSSTLVVITQLEPITVVFNVAEDDLSQVQAQLTGGRTLPVAAFDRAFDRKIDSGTLNALDNQVDTTTGTVKFRADFPNKAFELFPNQFVNAQLLVKTLRRVTLVPSAAVQHNGATAFVYVVKPDDTVAVQNVTVLSSNDQQTAVQGLNAGVTVATSGFDRLENGVKVVARGQRIGSSNSERGSK